MFDGLSDRALVVPALVLAFAIVWAWTAVLAGGPLGGSVAAFLVAWVAMMAAMMLPSAAPMVLLYRLSGSGPRGEVRTLVFASGYLLVWGAVGLAAVMLVFIASWRRSRPACSSAPASISSRR